MAFRGIPIGQPFRICRRFKTKYVPDAVGAALHNPKLRIQKPKGLLAAALREKMEEHSSLRYERRIRLIEPAPMCVGDGFTTCIATTFCSRMDFM